MKKIIAGITAILATISCISGCGQESKLVYYATWDGIDKNKVIASVKGYEGDANFDIKFGDFYSEYLYYLLSYGIEDDMEAAYKATCETYREDIITYITFERMFLYEAANTYGCGVPQLTPDDLTKIQEAADEVHESWKAKYYTIAIGEIGNTASTDEIMNHCEKLLSEDLAKCGLTTDIFYEWERNNYIQERVTEIITESIEISDEAVDKMYNDYYKIAVEWYEKDKSIYESNSTYTSLYVPDNARDSSHIFIPFDSDIQEDIADAREDKDDEEAAELLEEAYTDELKEKVDKIKGEIASGKDFVKLQEEYNPNKDTTVFTIIPESEVYYKEYLDTLFSLDVGKISDPVITDKGIYFIRYDAPSEVTEEEKKASKESMKEYLAYQEETEYIAKEYEKWNEKYEYVIDYELLQITIDPPTTTTTTSGATTTAPATTSSDATTTKEPDSE